VKVFLSYSHADKTLAGKLRRSLEERGLSFNDPGESSTNGTSWRQQVEEAIESADAILLLLSPRKKADEQQQLTWRLALQNVWANPAKRMIPILLQDAELPPFVRSGASGDFVQAIRLRDPRDFDRVVDAIFQSLQDKTGSQKVELPMIGARGANGPKSRGFGFTFAIPTENPIEIYPVVTDEDRARYSERLSEIRRYAEQLKH